MQRGDSEWKWLRNGKAITVLVVEDDRWVLNAIEYILKREKRLEVKTAASGEEAMAIISSGDPLHLLIADVRLPPGPQGTYVAEFFRAAFPQGKILFITGYVEEGINDTGDSALLLKPFSPQVLVEKTYALLSGSRGAHG